MDDIKYYEASEFAPGKLRRLKGDKKIFVIFFTCGDRESGLIAGKIRLIYDKLSGFVDRIFLAHRRRESGIGDSTEAKAREACEGIDIIICNNINVPDMGDEKGKGADMRRAVYIINTQYRDHSREDDIILIFLDSDVVPEYFGDHFVLGLAGGILGGADFAKASFWREMGRIKKFVAQPLFSLIDHPKLRRLTDFSYPLSGEVAGRLSFFNSVALWQMYGIETGINMDACFGNFKIADINLGLYDHEHHPDVNIQQMSFGIIRTFFLKLIEYGILELKDNAKIGDVFRASFISELGGRQFMEFDLSEKKYLPLKNIL